MQQKKDNLLKYEIIKISLFSFSLNIKYFIDVESWSRSFSFTKFNDLSFTNFNDLSFTKFCDLSFISSVYLLLSSSVQTL